MMVLIEMILMLVSVFVLGILIGFIIDAKKFKEFYRLFNEMNKEWYIYCGLLYNRCKKMQGECDGCKRCGGDEDNA